MMNNTSVVKASGPLDMGWEMRDMYRRIESEIDKIGKERLDPDERG